MQCHKDKDKNKNKDNNKNKNKNNNKNNNENKNKNAPTTPQHQAAPTAKRAHSLPVCAYSAPSHLMPATATPSSAALLHALCACLD